MRKWPTQVSTVVANVGRELSFLKMAINMANADYPSFFLWNELEPRCQQRAAGSLELGLILTHLLLVPHICVSESGQHWFRWRIVAYSTPSHYLNRCWVIVIIGTNFSEILINIQNFSFNKMDLKISSAKWRPFLSRVGWVKLTMDKWLHPIGNKLSFIKLQQLLHLILEMDSNFIQHLTGSWLIIVRRAGLLRSQQDFEWLWSVPLSSTSLY